MKTKVEIASLGLRLLAAAIMLQTLYFKFTGHEDSVYIFTQLHVEPYGRITAGISELIASILLLTPSKYLLGALMGFAIISAAILSHIFVLGLEIMNDGGKLFLLAVITWIACVAILYIHKNKIRLSIVKIWN